MKIALVHDELVRKGGAEQVLLSFHHAFPEAPIYTLAYNPDGTYPEFRNCRILTTWLGKFVKNEKNLKRLFFPFAVMAMKTLDLRGFDTILISTTHCGKYLKVDPDALVITYCHTPFRLLWRPETYDSVAKASGLKRKAYNTVIQILKKIDKKHADRTDYFITNAKGIIPRIEDAYHPKNPVVVINPPVKAQQFFLSNSGKEYYLVVSRFEQYKRVDLVIKAFNKLSDKRLIVVGKGSMEKELKKLAGANIEFQTGVDANALALLYANCKALVFPQLEDYGITPLEANASGRPVIAFGEGGVLDTMIPVNGSESKNATAVFFNQQTVESLITAINTFESLQFDSEFIRAHAEKFDEKVFIKNILEFVHSKAETKKQPSH